VSRWDKFLPSKEPEKAKWSLDFEESRRRAKDGLNYNYGNPTRLGQILPSAQKKSQNKRSILDMTNYSLQRVGSADESTRTSAWETDTSAYAGETSTSSISGIESLSQTVSIIGKDLSNKDRIYRPSQESPDLKMTRSASSQLGYKKFGIKVLNSGWVHKSKGTKAPVARKRDHNVKQSGSHGLFNFNADHSEYFMGDGENRGSGAMYDGNAGYRNTTMWWESGGAGDYQGGGKSNQGGGAEYLQGGGVGYLQGGGGVGYLQDGGSNQGDGVGYLQGGGTNQGDGVGYLQGGGVGGFYQGGGSEATPFELFPEDSKFHLDWDIDWQYHT